MSLHAADQREKLGFKTVLPLDVLDRALAGALGKETDLWLRLTFPDKADGARIESGFDYGEEYAHPYGDPTPGDRAGIRKLVERYPAAHQRDATAFIDEMRNIKTPQEIAVLRRNGALSAEGIKQGIAHARPGMYEYQIEAQAAFVFRNGGASGWAYPAIVGTGENINTWHYFNDRRQVQSGDLVVFDFAADFDHMAMDITRTFNVSGKFTAVSTDMQHYAAGSFNPISASFGIISEGNLDTSSHSITWGRISSSANSRTVRRNCFCSSVSENSKIPRYKFRIYATEGFIYTMKARGSPRLASRL